jgi:integrase
LPNEKRAREALDRLHLNINLDQSEGARSPRLFCELVEHYRRTELATDNDQKTYSTKECYRVYLVNWILPRWGEYTLAHMEELAPIHVEEWLRTIRRTRGTRAKIRNILSAVCSYALRRRWMKTNPIHGVRQSAKRERIPMPLTAEELQRLFGEVGLRDRVLLMLDVPTGMRRGELLAIQWRDIDFRERTLSIRRSIWQQHVGPTKTIESEKTMPLDDEIIGDLLRWRAETPYAQDEDWVFASPRMHGRQPLWPEAIMRAHIARAAKRAGITKRIAWHVFRHTFSTLLAKNNEDVKTVQSLMRHANSRITMDIYTHPISSKQRQAQSRVVEMILPKDGRTQIASIQGGTA